MHERPHLCSAPCGADIATTDYTFSFDPALEEEWTWSEKYATQPEILAYLRHVADRYDLRRDIELSTRVDRARWDGGESRWRIRTDHGDEVSCRFYVMATGCLSIPKSLDIEGVERFEGEVYFTSRWPHHPVTFAGKKVAVIGTGSSGIQCIPLIAAQAEALTVFQRTPNFSVPAHNGPPPEARLAALGSDRAAYRDAARRSRGGVPAEVPEVSGVAASGEVRRARFEAAWEAGELFAILGVFSDQLFNSASNELVAEMVREKIRATVADPETADALAPTSHPFGTKRPCLDTDYFQTFNLPHVRLVDLGRHPIATITERGIDTDDESIELDAIVFATGFDAMTGALVAVDIEGRDGLTLSGKWAGGPSTYLGLTSCGFPNLFMITGPGSPSVLSNMAVSIEQHVEWIAGCLDHLRSEGLETIEPTPLAEAGWDQHVADCGAITLYPQADSWYMGANVPGKPRVFYPYIGGVDAYRAACDEVVARGYLGFRLGGPGGSPSRCNDGVVRRLQPDVALVLQALEGLGLPRIETLGAEEARALVAATASMRPPGPAVGEVADGVLTGAAGPLPYRLYRPASGPLALNEPVPIVVYFHGGGWVMGDLDSDDPLCRDICARTGATVVSVNYRHAPEARFPAAADDAFAALAWVADHATELGGDPCRLSVAGWSAGANLAAVACQVARESGGPRLAAQLLLCPVTDCDTSRPSYVENGEGYVLTAALMEWFWDHYADPALRRRPSASPLRAAEAPGAGLAGLPPAVVVTAQFDPLRDEGEAYARALEAAGVEVRLLRARGHVHSSLTMVDVVLSGAPVRAEMAAALVRFLAAPTDRGHVPLARCRDRVT